MLRRAWENLTESCDLRLLFGTAAFASWLLLLAVSPIFTTASTLFKGNPAWRMWVLLFCFLGFTVMLLSTHKSKASFCEKHLSEFSLGLGFLSLLALLTHLYFEFFPVNAATALVVSACLVMLSRSWAQVFSSLRLRKRVVGTVAGSILGCFVYFIVVLLPPPFSLFVGACLPLISALFFMLYRTAFQKETPYEGRLESAFSKEELSATEKGKTDPSNNRESTPRRISRKNSKERVRSNHFFDRFVLDKRFALAILLFGVFFVFAGHSLPDSEARWLTSTVPGIIDVAVFLSIEIAITLYTVKRIHVESPIVAYKPSVLLVALAFMLMPLVPSFATIACMALVFGGFGSFIVFSWIVLGNTSQKFELPFNHVYAQGFCILFLGFILGETFSWVLMQVYPKNTFYLVGLSTFSLFLLVIMSWQMTDASRLANETSEMGGEFLWHENLKSTESTTTAEKDNLDRVVVHYGLSPRETEVLELLLKGRSIPYICDEFFLSKSTVQTHVRHIYAKMEIIGGRQQLLDTIEKFS